MRDADPMLASDDGPARSRGQADGAGRGRRLDRMIAAVTGLGPHAAAMEGHPMRKVSLVFAGALMGATAMTAVGSLTSTGAVAASSETYRQLAIFGDIFERVRATYVTPPDEAELVEAAINGMLTSLDPHSSYLNADDAQDMRTQTSGKFGGLGIEVSMEDELVKVIAPIADTPAEKAGVLSGDLIAEIDGEQVRGLSLAEAVDMMRGEVGEPIVLTILREGAVEPIEIEVIRDTIEVRAVKHRLEESEDGAVGYLRLISFTQLTYGDMKRAIEEIVDEVAESDGEQELKGFVVDLRLNPGGLLDQSVSVADGFLDRGEIVSTRGRNEAETRRYSARPGDLTGGLPIVVLINGGSASASEIVAGALQDHERALVVGTKSFGKGSVQTIFPLGQREGALRLTTGLYYTPSGTSIQGTGIVPDIIVEQELPEEIASRIRVRGESDLRGHISGENEDEEGSGSVAYVPTEPEDDTQLQYVLELIRQGKVAEELAKDGVARKAETVETAAAAADAVTEDNAVVEPETTAN